jgi:hypothetical protein
LAIPNLAGRNDRPHWGRLIYGGDGNMEKVANVVEMVAASAVFGVLAEALREVVQGQDPRARMSAAPGAM